MKNRKRFKNRSRRVTLGTKPSHHSSSLIKKIDGATGTVNSINKLIRAVASLILSIAGVLYIIILLLFNKG